MSGPLLDPTGDPIEGVASMNGDTQDVVQTVEAALVFQKAHGFFRTKAGAEFNVPTMIVDWLRALVERCKAAETDAQVYGAIFGRIANESATRHAASIERLIAMAEKRAEQAEAEARERQTRLAYDELNVRLAGVEEERDRYRVENVALEERLYAIAATVKAERADGGYDRWVNDVLKLASLERPTEDAPQVSEQPKPCELCGQRHPYALHTEDAQKGDGK